MACGRLPVAGLDELFGWSPPFGWVVKVLAFGVILDGYALGTYALIENPFFSGMVRLQTDRGHRVVAGGPYRWVRHSGYAGAMLAYLASPLALDAAWAVVPAGFLAVALVIRTELEDRTLRARLRGYADYAARVGYRLVPGIW